MLRSRLNSSRFFGQSEMEIGFESGERRRISHPSMTQHVGSARQIKKILGHLEEMKATWLSATAKQMARVVLKEWKEYRKN